MGTVIYVACLLVVIFLGWPPFLYRRFSRDGYGRPLGRAILCSICVYFLTVFITDLMVAYRTGPGGGAGASAFFRGVPGWLWLLLLVAPLPFNLFALIRGLVAVKK